MLGCPSVSRMLNSMTRREWLEWQTLLALEPLPGPREAALVATIVQELRNGRRTKATDKIATLEDCLLRFGDDLPPGPKRVKDWKAQKKAFFTVVRAYAKEAPRREGRR